MSEEQIKEMVEQVGYREFYRYFQEKTTLIEQQREEIERLNENNQAMQEEVCKVWEERDNAYRRILDAVDNLETPYFRECKQQCKDVIDILKGSDKE